MQASSILRYYELRNAHLKALLQWTMHQDPRRLAQQGQLRNASTFSAIWNYVFRGSRAKVSRCVTHYF